MLTKTEQEEFYKITGNLIKIARNQTKISQEDLAQQLGFVSRISVVNIESGKQKVLLHTLLEISEFLNVPLNDLLPSVESVKQGISTKFAKKITKEFAKEISDDPLTIEKIKSFIRLSSSKHK